MSKYGEPKVRRLDCSLAVYGDGRVMLTFRPEGSPDPDGERVSIHIRRDDLCDCITDLLVEVDGEEERVFTMVDDDEFRLLTDALQRLSEPK